MTDAEAVQQFEAFVLAQRPAKAPWQPVTPYDLESRKVIEGIHPQLIHEVFQPSRVLDVGCGAGFVLVRLLRERGLDVEGWDPSVKESLRQNLRAKSILGIVGWPRADLVICREVLEHLTVLQLRRAVANLVMLSSRYVYVTTRFAQAPTHLLSVDGSDALDPTHISMLTKAFLRTLFVLEGCKSRPDLEARLDHRQLGRCLVMELA